MLAKAACFVLFCALVHMNVVYGRATWDRVQTQSNVVPAARSRPVLLEGDGYLWLFGGQYDNDTDPNGYVNYNDVHVFNLHTKTWTKLQVNGDKPAPRVFAGGFRSGVDRFTIYGGVSYDQGPSNIQFFSDFWEFDVSKRDWKQIVPKGDSIPPILGLEAVVKGQKAYLFGGATNTFQDQNELYVYDISSRRLTLINVQGVRPAPRHHTCIIDIPAEDKFIIFYGDRITGGIETGAFEYDISRKRYSPVVMNGDVPSPRQYFTGVAFGYTWYGFGGDLPSGIPGSSNTTGGTFKFHYPTLRWTELHPRGEVPPSLKRHRAVSISDRRDNVEAMAIFGGFTQNAQETNNVQIFNRNLYVLTP